MVTAKNYLQQFNAGSLTLDEAYKTIGTTDKASGIRNAFASLVSQQGGKRVAFLDSKMISQIDSQIQNVRDLLGEDGYNYKIISGGVQGGALGFGARATNAKGDSLAVLNNILKNQTLQALVDAKEKGITFGSLSEGELNAVAASASRLASAAIADKDTGKFIGLNMSESQTKKELDNILSSLEKSKSSATGGSGLPAGDITDFENLWGNVNSNTTTTKSFISGFNFNK